MARGAQGSPLQPGPARAVLPALLCLLMFLASTSAGVSSEICTASSARETRGAETGKEDAKDDSALRILSGNTLREQHRHSLIPPIASAIVRTA